MLRLFQRPATAQAITDAAYSAFETGLRHVEPYPDASFQEEPGLIREAIFVCAASARAAILHDPDTTSPAIIEAHRRLCHRYAVSLGPFQPAHGAAFEHIIRYDAILRRYIPTGNVDAFDDLVEQYLALANDDYTPNPPVLAYAAPDTPTFRQWLDRLATIPHTQARTTIARIRPLK